MSVPLGKVTKDMTRSFAKAWDLNGIKVILDDTTMQFATDWANIALKSYYLDLQKAVSVIQAKRTANPSSRAPVDAVSPSTPAGSLPLGKIVLTD